MTQIMSKIIFRKYLPPVRPKLVPKLKMLRIYWSLTQMMFRISRSWFWCQKWFLLNIYHLLGPSWSKIKYAQKLLKFGLIDISSMPISILMSKIILMKYLPPVRPKLVPKMKMLRIYRNLPHLIFQICQFWF